MSETKPVLDLDDALHRAMGDADFLKLMMDELQRTIPDVITRLQDALALSDMETIGKTAHQIKGAAANLGAKALAAVAMEMEMAGKSESPESAQQVFRQLQYASKELNQHLDRIDWSAVAL